jgi:hypothetical protein
MTGLLVQSWLFAEDDAGEDTPATNANYEGPYWKKKSLSESARFCQIIV